MVIYLDANIVQYLADFGDFVFRASPNLPVSSPWLQGELNALRELIELEQLGHWDFAAPEHLLAELHRGRPTVGQRETYAILEDAAFMAEPCRRDVGEYSTSLLTLGLARADRRHLATALAMSASWFLTCDRGILRRVAKAPGGWRRAMRVAPPSRAIEEITRGLFLL